MKVNIGDNIKHLNCRLIQNEKFFKSWDCNADHIVHNETNF